MYDILRLKHEIESGGGKATAAKVAEQFAANLKLSKFSEQIAPSTVESALMLANRVLCQPRALAAIRYAEEEWGRNGPFNSIYKLQEVVSRAQAPDSIDWAFESLCDSVRMQFIDSAEVTVRNIGDRGSKYLGGCALLKRSLRDYFLTDYLTAAPNKFHDHWPSDVRNKLRSIFADHSSVRKALTAYPGSAEHDLTWQRTWPESAIASMDLFEAPEKANIFARHMHNLHYQLHARASVLRTSSSRLAKGSCACL